MTCGCGWECTGSGHEDNAYQAVSDLLHLEKFFLLFQPFWCLQVSELLVRAWRLGWARAGDSVGVAAPPLALGMGTQGLSSFKSPGN